MKYVEIDNLNKFFEVHDMKYDISFVLYHNSCTDEINI